MLETGTKKTEPIPGNGWFCSHNQRFPKEADAVIVSSSFGGIKQIIQRKKEITIMETRNDMSTLANGKRICLLDLNYTLVSNQKETRMLRPFSKRMEGEEYRLDLIEAIKDDYVIIVTARPDYQMKETMANVRRKTGWEPQEIYFNDINAEPPVFKDSALRRFIFPKHGANPEQFYAVESNPKTRAMYARYGIGAAPYEKFIKASGAAGQPQDAAAEPVAQQMSLFN